MNKKHEYINTGWGQLTCIHCGVIVNHEFLTDNNTYHNMFGTGLLTEPPCITRKIQADEK